MTMNNASGRKFPSHHPDPTFDPSPLPKQFSASADYSPPPRSSSPRHVYTWPPILDSPVAATPAPLSRVSARPPVMCALAPHPIVIVSLAVSLLGARRWMKDGPEPTRGSKTGKMFQYLFIQNALARILESGLTFSPGLNLD